MKKEETKNKKDKKDKKTIDLIIMLILIAFLIAIAIFTITRRSSNQEIVLMEIYKSAGPDTSTNSTEYYYVYENTNNIEIRSSNSDGSNTTVSKELNQDLIDNFQKSLDEYIASYPTINTSFYVNERYTIEYNGTSFIVPNPSVASTLGFDSNKYMFYNTVQNFINTIKN